MPNRFCAYAKINLGLLVKDRRPDGYHNIETVFHRIDLHDEITMEEADRITVQSSDAAVPSNERNICHKAASFLQQHLGIRKGITISIQKNIPVGAGLGGGSSDAATVLRELPRFWGGSIDEPTLHQLALQLGSDVPYFLGQGTALGRGRGEILEYFKLDIPFTILLCYPGVHVSTAWAYQQVTPTVGRDTVDLKDILTSGMNDPALLREELCNDFEPVVFKRFPVVLEVKEMMLSGGAVFALMSGSGSSVFGLFGRKESASTVEKNLNERGWVTSLTAEHLYRSPSGW